MEWQCVFLCWGTKYSSKDVLEVAQNVSRNANKQPRFKLVTDQIKKDLPPDIEQILLPPFYRKKPFLNSGCQAKLSMFEPDVLEPNMLAIYVDLDTAVWGDLSVIATSIKNKDEIHMFTASFFKPNKFWRFLSKLTNKNIHVRGNSSIVAFYPDHNSDISKSFRELYEKSGTTDSFKPLRADDRFISWYAQARYRAIPTKFAVKFRNEFMGRSKLLLRLKTLCPWIEGRRKKLYAITFPGLNCKPSELLLMKDGQEISDNRKRKLVWSENYLGNTKSRIEEYYRTK